jgi:hypothetical protein
MTTNKGLLRPAASAFVLALLVNACTTNTRAIDTSGRKVSLETPHIAEHHLSDGRIVVYASTPDDVNQLIRELQQLGVTDQQVLSPETWSLKLCSMGFGGQCGGHCPIGACKLVGIKSETRQVVPTEWSVKPVPFKWCSCVALSPS